MLTNLTIKPHPDGYRLDWSTGFAWIPLHMLTKFANGREVTDEVVEEYIEREVKNNFTFI